MNLTFQPTTFITNEYFCEFVNLAHLHKDHAQYFFLTDLLKYSLEIP